MSSQHHCKDFYHNHHHHDSLFIFLIPFRFFLAEVLFEPDTKFRVLSVTRDGRCPDVTRVCVEVIETPPVLCELIQGYVADGLLV